jgi:hypothetical protein
MPLPELAIRVKRAETTLRSSAAEATLRKHREGSADS